MIYDAERAPSPESWLAAAEPARVAAVEAHHRTLSAPHPATPKPRVHAAIHVVVETQLAADRPPEARRALDRLVRAGRSRHEAIHAIAEVVAAAAQAALSGDGFDAGAYARALEALGAEPGRGGGPPDDCPSGPGGVNGPA